MNEINLNARDSGIELNKMLKLEAVVSGEDQEMVTDMMKGSGVTGYTVIPHVSGYGHDGFHEGRMLFNDKSSLVLIMVVAPEEIIKNIAEGMKALFQGKSGVMFISEVSVARFTYFSS